MKHFLVFNYDFPKYLRVDVGPYPHRDKQGRYMLQPNRVNGRIIYKQITGKFCLYDLSRTLGTSPKRSDWSKLKATNRIAVLKERSA